MKNKNINKDMKEAIIKPKKQHKNMTKYIKLTLYITALIMIYLISPILTEWFKIGLQTILNVPNENITRFIAIILVAIMLIFILKKNKKEGE